MPIRRGAAALTATTLIAALLTPGAARADRHARRRRAPQAPADVVPKAAMRVAPDASGGIEGRPGLSRPPRCQAVALQGYHTTRVRICPVSLLARVEAWQPDAVIALGGGTLRNGEPGCASEQRAWTAASVFEQLGRRPTLVLSGAGDAVPSRALTGATRRCALERRARELLAAQSQGGSEVARLEREIARFAHARRASLTEAEYMCATVLDAYPRRDWDTVLAHMVLETRASTTVQNVARTMPILLAGGFARALLVSTPTYRLGRGVENHAYRAWALYRRRRPQDATFRLGAIACPFGRGGPSWSGFE